jgi:hypothetical protein
MLESQISTHANSLSSGQVVFRMWPPTFLKIDIDTLRAGSGNRVGEVGLPMVDARIEAELVHHVTSLAPHFQSFATLADDIWWVLRFPALPTSS